MDLHLSASARTPQCVATYEGIFRDQALRAYPLLNAVLTEVTGHPLYSTKCFASINPVPAPQVSKQAEGNRDRRLPLVAFRAALNQTVVAAAL